MAQANPRHVAPPDHPRRPRRGATAGHLLTVVLAFALIATACSGDLGLPEDDASSDATNDTTDASDRADESDPTTTEPAEPVALGSVELPTFDNDDEELPVDPAVRRGELDNGLQYYIRQNDNPGQRATLRLAIDAGSIHEDEDQLGGAHFLEHMLFNGTEAFPANDLIRVLESFGSDFGADVNAYTSFGETVYTLQIPVDDPDIIATAFTVLAEWAAKATIDPEQVDLEAGVVVEEWRRGRNFWSRYYEQVVAALLSDTPYEKRLPIGNEESILDMTPDALRRFYEDWYRPELMAVVVVGDVDLDETEREIIDGFSDLSNPPGAPEREPVRIAAAEEPTFIRLADAESADTFVELNYPLPARPYTTIGPIRADLAHDLALLMLQNRLAEDVQRGGAPFYEASGAANPLAREQQTGGLFAYADPENAAATLEALLVEIERGRRNGFGEAELERAVTQLRSTIEQTFEQRESKQDNAYADQYVAHFLEGAPISSAQDERDLYTTLLDEMTVQQVHATFRSYIESTEPLLIVAGPESADAALPTSIDMQAILNRVRSGDITERLADDSTIDALMSPPDPAEITNRRVLDEITFDGSPSQIIEFANGVTVTMIETEIVTNEISLQATSPGGWSIEPAGDTVEAQFIPTVVAQSGVAEFDRVSLDRFLADRTVTMAPYIDEIDEGFSAAVATDDAEVLFQLLHLSMTQPRADDAALRSFISGTRPLAVDLTQDPNVAATQALYELRYENNDRYFAYPPLDELDTFDLDVGLDIYERHFGDASDFVFSFAGDFDSAEIEDLAARYLGTLPSDGEPDEYADVQPPTPGNIRRTVVEAGDEQASITYLFSEPATYDESALMTARYLEIITGSRLRDRIREELSASYSPYAAVQFSTDPTVLTDVFMQITGDPDRLAEIDAAVRADIADLQANGPTDAQFEAARESLRREFELVNNPLYMERLTYYATNPSADPAEFALRPSMVNRISKDDVTRFANQVLPLDRYIEVQLVPTP